MNAEDLRLLLLRQRKLFGTQEELAHALGVSEQAVSQFIGRKHKSLRADCRILEALGLEVVTEKVLKPKEEL